MNNQDVINYVMNTPHNTNPAILNQMLNSRDISWNDLKDKPFYFGETEVVLCADEKIGFSSQMSRTSEKCNMSSFVVGQTYKVLLDGTCYVCIAFASHGLVWIGNPSFAYNGGEDNGMPFAMYVDYYDEVGGNVLGFDRGKSGLEKIYTVTITTMVETAHTLDPKYLPCDLMFKVGCTGLAHPKYDPANMTKPTIVSGSLEAVLEKLANGEIPVVKVQYMGVWDKNISMSAAYGGEFTCDTFLYSSSIVFDHFIAHGHDQISVRIALDIDDPDFIEMQLYPCKAYMSPIIID